MFGPGAIPAIPASPMLRINRCTRWRLIMAISSIAWGAWMATRQGWGNVDYILPPDLNVFSSNLKRSRTNVPCAV